MTNPPYTVSYRQCIVSVLGATGTKGTKMVKGINGMKGANGAQANIWSTRRQENQRLLNKPPCFRYRV